MASSESDSATPCDSAADWPRRARTAASSCCTLRWAALAASARNRVSAMALSRRNLTWRAASSARCCALSAAPSIFLVAGLAMVLMASSSAAWEVAARASSDARSVIDRWKSLWSPSIHVLDREGDICCLACQSEARVWLWPLGKGMLNITWSDKFNKTSTLITCGKVGDNVC